MVVDRSQSRLLFHRGTNTHGFIPKKKYVMKSGPVYTCMELVGSVEHKIICFSHQNHTLFITSLHSFYFSVNFDRKKKKKEKSLVFAIRDIYIQKLTFRKCLHHELLVFMHLHHAGFLSGRRKENSICLHLEGQAGTYSQDPPVRYHKYNVKGNAGIHNLTSYRGVGSSYSDSEAFSIPVTAWKETGDQPQDSSTFTFSIRGCRPAKVSFS